MLLKSKVRSGNVSEDLESVVEIDDPLTTECDDESVFGRPRSRSASPCEGGQELEGKPAKPVPQPRTRAQTMTVSVAGGRKVHQPVPYSPSSPALGTVPSSAVAISSRSGNVAPVISSSAPRSSNSPIPKPRSNTIAKPVISSISTETAKASTKLESVGDSSRRSLERGMDSDMGSMEERSDSTCSNYSSSSAEKIKASLTLQKLLPRKDWAEGWSTKGGGMRKVRDWERERERKEKSYSRAGDNY